MKKFYGLKMAFAVLVAGAAFVSCSDSDAGDIYIPTTPSGGSTVVKIEYPAAIYVVNGVVTDAATSTAIEGVAVSGAVTATTDANGYFTSGSKSAPINGVVSFAKSGYTTVNRTVVMPEATTGTVSEAMNVVMSSGSAPAPVGTLVPIDGGESYPLTDKAVTISGAALASLYNNTDKDKIVEFDASDLGLVYGAVVPAEKGLLEDLVKAFVDYNWGNDPFVGYGKYIGKLLITVPAGAKAQSLTLTPLAHLEMAVFESEEGLLEQILEICNQYNVSAVFIPIDAHDAHDVHNGENVGGGDAGGI
jgi:hypothetical protein